MNIEDYIRIHAVEQGNHVALICGNNNLTYSQLQSLIDERAAEFEQSDEIAVVVRNTQSIDFLVTYFAAHVANKVMIPLESDIPKAKFGEICRTIKDSYIPDEIADILFTTGTTGQQKGAMISHRAIMANAENLIDSQGFRRDVTFIISGPLNHIGSLSKVWAMIVVGGTVVITEGMKDINAFFFALDSADTKIATFLVPASIRIVLQFGAARLSKYADKIDFIETGAAPMAESDMRQLTQLLPRTRLYNTYASTETGIVATYDYCNNGCIAGCLGHAMRHASIHIQSDGTVACSGRQLMTGYVGAPNATAEVLRDGMIYTSDLGHFDAKGRLRLEGRKDDVINVGGYKVSPVEIENCVNSFPDIADCICTKESHPIAGTILKLIYAVKPNAYSFNKKALIYYMKKNLEAYKMPRIYEQAQRIERTYNGKLNRKFYEILSKRI